MKILYFDIWSPKGHIVFNNIHLKALSQLGDVYTVFREGYYKFDYAHVIPYLEIPDKFYTKSHGYFFNRIILARMIRWVWAQVSSEKWDYIIISSYEPFELYLSQRFKKSIVIDHKNAELLENRIQNFSISHLSKDMMHVVFTNGMKSRLVECGINNVSIVPHGFLPMKTEDLSHVEEQELMQKYSLLKSDKIVFLPSLSKASKDLLGQELYNEDFNEFLKHHGLKLFTKSKVKRESMSNIIIINGYLPEKDYKYLFLHSSCNILLYSEDFKYRTSGVLNECFANNIPCVFSDCPGLKEYLPFINNEHCVFRNADELKRSILSVTENCNRNYYRNLEEIESPLKAWEEILK